MDNNELIQDNFDGMTTIDASNEVDQSHDMTEPVRNTGSVSTAVKTFTVGVATAAAAGVLTNVVMEYLVRPGFAKLAEIHEKRKMKRLQKKEAMARTIVEEEV